MSENRETGNRPAWVRPFAWAVIALATWLMPLAVAAQIPLGTEFQINTYSTGSQFQSAIAADSSGNFIAVWVSRQDGSPYGIFAQRFDSAGAQLGAEFQVNTYTTGEQRAPSVASDASGNFVVVWADYQRGQVFGQRFDSTGATVGTEFQANTNPAGGTRPSVASDPSGNFIVTWFNGGQDGSGNGVFAQRFDSSGAAAGTEFQVNSYTTGNQSDSKVAINASGNFVVVWDSLDQDGSYSGIFGQRFDSAGTALGTEFQVNTYTTNHQDFPVVSSDASGNFVVVWQSKDQGGPGTTGAFAQRFDSNGTAAGTEFQVSTPGADPAVASDASGNFVVTYERSDGSGSLGGVFGQLFDSAGSTVGTQFAVNTFTFDNQWSSSVATDAAGNFVVAWQSFNQDFGDSGTGIFGQRFSSTIAPTPVPSATLTPTPTPAPPSTATSSPAATDSATSTPGACAATPIMGCPIPGKSILLIKDLPPFGPTAFDKLLWKWLRGPQTQQSDFGDPVTTTGYSLCLYTGASPELKMTMTAGSCGTLCWQPLSDKGYKYFDFTAANDGVFKVLLKGGAAGKAKILVKGKDGQIPLPTLALDTSGDVIVQLQNTNGDCWSASYPPSSIKRNDVGQFKAKVL